MMVILCLHFYNIKEEDIEIKKGESIGQALFQKYLIADDDKAEGKKNGWIWFNKKIKKIK